MHAVQKDEQYARALTEQILHGLPVAAHLLLMGVSLFLERFFAAYLVRFEINQDPTGWRVVQAIDVPCVNPAVDFHLVRKFVKTFGCGLGRTNENR